VLDVNRIRSADLVLKVSEAVDPERFDTSRYGNFIDLLCGTREYQKDAIRTALRYFLGGRYADANALADENFKASPALSDYYGTESNLHRRLLFPDRLSASLDLATGTGKSYVMYGVAAIMLAEGAVDQVLVICPSTTIETGLLEKFRALTANDVLRDALPADAEIHSPSIITANESITAGAICVENYHQTLPEARSSIRTSLAGKGSRTLVLNDEAHHLFAVSGDLKKWPEFVGDNAFNFRYILGVSGTSFNGDEYFPDVIARYSLRDAIDAGFVKTIDYVAEDSPGGRDEKFQKIYDNHVTNKMQTYRKVKPLTLFVTRDISACKALAAELTAFIAEREGIPAEDAARKVIAVTSDAAHRANVAQLPLVDNADNPVEWIVSVSMLTEGWDVKNVLQIVPHEERAFSSKLLIAQVLGRGLRIPDEYRGERPVVTVFNHDAWSGRIRHLVDEVLEIESRAYSAIVDKEVDYNFSIAGIDYTKTQEVENHEATEEFEFTKGYVTLASQVEVLERETTYARAVSGAQRQKRTAIRYKMFPLDDVAEHIHLKFKAIDLEAKTSYAERYSLDWLRNVISESLKRAGESEPRVSEENRQRLQAAFGVVHRRNSQTVRYKMSPHAVTAHSTRDRNRDSVGVSALRRSEASVFIDDQSLALSDEATAAVLREVVEDETLPRSAYYQAANHFDFKTPLNIVITNHRPEREFVRKLIQPENAKAMRGWVKSTDQDFYQVEYAWRKGEHFRRGFFNPDFFISIEGHVIIVEIKGDEEIDDPSAENRAKYRAAKEHFALVNELTDGVRHHFHFLSPKDYDAFFQFLRDGRLDYASSLDAALAMGQTD
jgi:type III restriction enzyme